MTCFFCGREAGRGEALLMARSTQWDVINDPAGSTRYVAWVLVFDDELVRGLTAAGRKNRLCRARLWSVSWFMPASWGRRAWSLPAAVEA